MSETVDGRTQAMAARGARRAAGSGPAGTIRRLGASIAAFALGVAPAHAHVKWFAPYDVSAAPKAIGGLANATMLGMAAVALVVLWIAGRIEETHLAARCKRVLDRLCPRLAGRMDDFLRATTAAFFVSLWAIGGIILTPELTTHSAWVPWLQAAIACCMFWRASLPAASLGMVVLYACGIATHGLFHMMDYPIFLGLAAYHALAASGSQDWRARRFDALRVGAAVTLMWASVEKWAYPQWTQPLLDAHAGLTFGLGHGSFMIIAGIVEFSLAFGLLCGPLVRRASALVLATMFTAAILEFGKIDAIGHLMIIAILVSIMLDSGQQARRSPIGSVATYPLALAGTVALYYGGHALMFGI